MVPPTGVVSYGKAAVSADVSSLLASSYTQSPLARVSNNPALGQYASGSPMARRGSNSVPQVASPLPKLLEQVRLLATDGNLPLPALLTMHTLLLRTLWGPPSDRGPSCCRAC